MYYLQYASRSQIRKIQSFSLQYIDNNYSFRQQPGSEDYADEYSGRYFFDPFDMTDHRQFQLGEYPNRDTACVNHVICVSPAIN